MLFPGLKIRVSTASAALLGLKKLTLRSKSKTVYLMNSGGCVFDCSFCSQAKGASSKQDKLSRVSWPEYDFDTVLAALSDKGTSEKRTSYCNLHTSAANASQLLSVSSPDTSSSLVQRFRSKCANFVTKPRFSEVPKASDYKRICMQVVNTPHIFETLPEIVAKLREHAVDSKLAITIRTYKMEHLDAIFDAGADEIGLSIDVADPVQFQKVRGGSFEQFKEFVLRATDKYPGKIATHLIVGMGETEKQMVELMEKLHERHVIIALFAFTPVSGSRMEFCKPPDVSVYRRIQIALHLIRNHLKRDFTYDEHRRIVDFGLCEETLFKLLQHSNVFETSGCSDCNRPYYNERAGATNLYNYPEKLSRDEFMAAFRNY